MGVIDYLWQLVTSAFPLVMGVVPDLARVEEASEVGGILQRITPGWFEISLFKVGDVAVTIGAVIRFVLIVMVTWWLSKLAQAAMTRIAALRPNFGEAPLYTLNRLLHYAILTIGFLVALSTVGVDFSKLALFASALGVGIGFGLQNLISNFVAGLMLLFEKSLKVGDYIELQSGIVGQVREIRMRSTLITTNDNVDIVVPNSEFVNGHVMNWTMRDVNRRIHVPFGVAYGSDKELVRKAVLEAAEATPHTLLGAENRKPQVWLTEFADSSLNFELIVWLTSDAVKRYGAVRADYLWAIDTALKKYNIEIPFPQRDLHVRSWAPEARPPAAPTA